MKIFLLLSTVLLMVSAQVPDSTNQATATLQPVISQVDTLNQVTSAVLNNVVSAVNPSAVDSLTSVVNSGLVSSLTSQFDALGAINDAISASGVTDALECAVNASTAILGSVTNGASNTVNCLLNIVQGVPNLLTQVTNVVQQLALNTVTNALSLITSCVAKALLSLDLTGALACAGTIINQVLSVVTSLLSTIAAVLGQAVNLVLSLAGCAVTALATVLQIAGTAVSSAVTCASQVGVLNIVLPPLNNIIPDFNSIIQAGVNLLLQLNPLIQQIQTLITSLTQDLNALLKKVSDLTGQVVQNALTNAVSSALGLINTALSLNVDGASACANTAQQNVASLIQNSVSDVLQCAAQIASVAQGALGEVTSYATQVVNVAVSNGIPVIVKCAVGVLSLDVSSVQKCVDAVVNTFTSFVTNTLNRLQELVVQAQNLAAAVDNCLDSATALLIQAADGAVSTLRSCLGALGVTI